MLRAVACQLISPNSVTEPTGRAAGCAGPEPQLPVDPVQLPGHYLQLALHLVQIGAEPGDLVVVVPAQHVVAPVRQFLAVVLLVPAAAAFGWPLAVSALG